MRIFNLLVNIFNTVFTGAHSSESESSDAWIERFVYFI